MHRTPMSRSDIRTRYSQVRATTIALCEPLEVEDTVIQSMPDVSPPKWHLGHTTWFFETFVLERARPRYRPVEPSYRALFNSYYEAVGDSHPRDRRGVLARPTLRRVHAYRSAIDERIAELCDAATEAEWPALADTIVLGIHHEQQHQELLLMDILHNFYADPSLPVYRQLSVGDGAAPSMVWIAVAGGEREIGSAAGGEFSFDNERPRHRVIIPPHELASRPITSAEWLEFIDDGGYDRPELWLADGWQAARERGWKAPLYWEHRDGRWRQFSLGGWRDIGDEPVVHVSYYEADAFARWTGARLPTEAEWEAAASARPVTGNLADGGPLHPTPARDAGLAQIYGDVWEWTQSAYAPYPGFAPQSGALGEYNGKFMCNQLVLRGGSCATPVGHVRASYRNFFYPHQRWCFAGVRLAR